MIYIPGLDPSINSKISNEIPDDSKLQQDLINKTIELLNKPDSYSKKSHNIWNKMEIDYMIKKNPLYSCKCSKAIIYDHHIGCIQKRQYQRPKSSGIFRLHNDNTDNSINNPDFNIPHSMNLRTSYENDDYKYIIPSIRASKGQIINDTQNLENFTNTVGNPRFSVSTTQKETKSSTSNYGDLLASLKIENPSIINKLAPEKQYDIETEKLMRDLDKKIDIENFNHIRGVEIFEKVLRNSNSVLKKKQPSYDTKIEELILPENKEFHKNISNSQKKPNFVKKLFELTNPDYKGNNIQKQIKSSSKSTCKEEKEELINIDKCSSNMMVPVPTRTDKPSRPTTAHTNIFKIRQKSKAWTSFLDVDLKSGLESVLDTSLMMQSGQNDSTKILKNPHRLSERAQKSNNFINHNDNDKLNNQFIKNGFSNSISIRSSSNNNKLKASINCYDNYDDNENVINSYVRHQAKATALKDEAEYLKNSMYDDINKMKHQIIKKLNNNNWVDDNNHVNQINNSKRSIISSQSMFFSA